MYNQSIQLNNELFIRIDKRKARNLYNKGFDILIIPDKTNDLMQCELINNQENIDFNTYINNFIVDHCINCLVGYRVAFYKEVSVNE